MNNSMLESNTQEPVGQYADGAMTENSHTADAVGAYIKNGVDHVVQTSNQLSDSAHNATARTANYIREEPIKSVLIAAATGAALVALVGMVRRSPERS